MNSQDGLPRLLGLKTAVMDEMSETLTLIGSLVEAPLLGLDMVSAGLGGGLRGFHGGDLSESVGQLKKSSMLSSFWTCLALDFMGRRSEST